jgi:hypothetical protein
VRSAPSDSPAWSALLPDDSIWLFDPRHQGARRFRRAVASVPPGRTWTIARPPFASRRSPYREQGSQAHDVHTYVAYPYEKPMLIATKDAAVLRYVADSVLSVPPGAGRIPSIMFTTGMRLLRMPLTWSIAAVVRATDMVVVGRSE